MEHAGAGPPPLPPPALPPDPPRGEETPSGETPLGGEAGRGDQTPLGGEETPLGGEETPLGGEADAARGEETPLGGEASPAPTQGDHICEIALVEEGREVLVALAEEAEMDAVAIECDHASSRRRASRVQAQVSRVSWTSGLRLAHKLSSETRFGWQGRVKAALGESRCSNTGRAVRANPRRIRKKAAGAKRGGGGAWRYHQGVQAERDASGKWKKGASAAYRRMPENDRATAANLGHLATRAHQEGASGFGGRQRRHDPRAKRLRTVLRKLRKQHLMNAAASTQGQPPPAWDRAAAVETAR